MRLIELISAGVGRSVQSGWMAGEEQATRERLLNELQKILAE